MPVEFVNMVGSRPPGSVVPGGNTFTTPIDVDWLRHYARTIEAYGFDYTLIPYASASADQYALSATVLAATQKLKTVVAVRPNSAFPTVAAQGLASHAPANVGLAILRRYHLTIDFAGDRMWLRPDADAATQPFRKNRAGLAVTPQEGRYLRVTHVALDSPAQAAGWKVGELISSIDGQAIDPGYPASALSRWTFGPPGQVVALTLSDGSRRLLSLAEYY